MDTFLYYLPPLAVLLIWAERMREVRTRRETIPGKRKETLTFTLFMVSGVVIFAGGIAEYLLVARGPSVPFFVIGLALSVTSFIIRRKTIAALGKFWSLHVEMREGHEFVRSGPLRWMRHPVYFSMILELLGPALMLNAACAFAMAMAIFIPTMWWRVRIEEAALVEKFGPAYEEYRRTTPMMIPYRFPKAK